MSDVDDLITSALCGVTPWPNGMDTDLVVTRATYHGVTGLMIARAAHFADWPKDVIARLRAEAVAQTMWEIRHRSVLTPLLAALDALGVGLVLLKGTAMAYGLYSAPAQRARGDTDILIAPEDLNRTRDILMAQGFDCDVPMNESPDAPERQESWVFKSADGARHEVDLHVDVFSSPALQPVLTTAQALTSAIPLPALSPTARALPLPLSLLQACLHRAQHVVTPYSVGQEWHYGGDRLIWLMDINLAWRAMTDLQRDQFKEQATRARVGPICAEALQNASSQLKTPNTDKLISDLELQPLGPAARYLMQSHSLGRVMSDLSAIPSFSGKLRHAILRFFPQPNVLRARYPDLETASLPRLYLRRISGLIKKRKADKT